MRRPMSPWRAPLPDTRVQQTLLAQDGEPGLQVMTTKAGDKYLFGDALNYLLVPRTREEAEGKVWSHAAGGAVSAGLAEPPPLRPGAAEMVGRHRRL